MSRITSNSVHPIVSRKAVRRQKRSLVLAAAVAGIGLFMGRAQAYEWTWNGNVSNEWSNASNWTQTNTSFPYDDSTVIDAVFNTDGNNDFLLSTNTGGGFGLFANSMTFGGSQTWQISGANALDLRGGLSGGWSVGHQLTVNSGTTVILQANYTAQGGSDGGFTKKGEGELRLLGTGNTALGASDGVIFHQRGTISFNNLAALGTAVVRFGVEDYGSANTGLGSGPAILKYTGVADLTLDRVRALNPWGNGGISVANADTTVTINNVITRLGTEDVHSLGQYALIKQGPGTLELKPEVESGSVFVQAANSYWGHIKVEEGTLKIHDLRALGDGRNRIVLDGGTLQLNNRYRSSADPTLIPTAFDPGDGNTDNGGDSKFRYFEIGPNGGTLDIQAFSLQLNDGPMYQTEHQLQGSGVLTKKGPGKLLLGNAAETAGWSAFTGTLNVLEGVVRVDHSDVSYSGMTVAGTGVIAHNAPTPIATSITIKENGRIGSAGGSREYSGTITVDASAPAFTFHSADPDQSRVIQNIGGVPTVVNQIIDRTTTLSGTLNIGNKNLIVTGNDGNTSQGLRLTSEWVYNGTGTGTGNIQIQNGGVFIVPLGTSQAFLNRIQMAVVNNDPAELEQRFGPVIGFTTDQDGQQFPTTGLNLPGGNYGFYVGPTTAGTTGNTVNYASTLTVNSGAKLSISGAGNYTFKPNAINFSGVGGTLNVAGVTVDGTGFVANQAGKNITLAGNATGVLDLRNNVAPAFNFNNLTLAGGTIRVGGAAINPTGTLAFGSANLELGAGGVLNVPSNVNVAGTSRVSGAGKVALGGGPRDFNVNSGTLRIETPIENGSLIKSGPGTLALTAANPTLGSVTVAGGVLDIQGNAGAIGAGTLTLAGGTFRPGGLSGTYMAGLTETRLSGANNQAAFTQATRIEQGLRMAQTNAGGADLWADNTTFAYMGEIYLPGPTSFAAQIDDNVLLRINGQTLINDTTWNNVDWASYGDQSVPRPEPSGGNGWVSTGWNGPGWYSFELRVGNGGGGAGAANQNPAPWTGWSTSKGFGYSITNSNSTNAADYAIPVNTEGNMIFRTMDPWVRPLSLTNNVVVTAPSLIDLAGPNVANSVTEFGALEIHDGGGLGVIGPSGHSAKFTGTKFVGTPALVTFNGGLGVTLNLGPIDQAFNTVGTVSVTGGTTRYSGTLRASSVEMSGGRLIGDTLNFVGAPSINYIAGPTSSAAILDVALNLGGATLPMNIADGPVSPDLTLGKITNGTIIKQGPGSLGIIGPNGQANVVLESGGLSVGGENPLGTGTITVKPNQVLTLGRVEIQPGLLRGNLAGAWDASSPNPGNGGIAFIPTAARVGGWTTGDNTTVVYTGMFNAGAGGTFNFAEHFDDNVLLRIGGQQVLNNTQWDVPTMGGITLTPGWHEFELRFGQGTGGVGPVANANGNWFDWGFGYDPNGTAISTDQSQYQEMIDNGTGNLFLAVSSYTPLTNAGSTNVVLEGSAEFNMIGAPIGTVAGLGKLTAPFNGSEHLTVSGGRRVTFTGTKLVGTGTNGFVTGPGGYVRGTGMIDFGDLDPTGLTTFTTLTKSGTADLAFGGQMTLTNGVVTLDGGTIGNTVSGTQRGVLKLQGGAPRVNFTGVQGTAGTIAADIDFGTAQGVVNVANTPSTRDLVLQGNLSGRFNKTGPGVLALTGDNAQLTEARFGNEKVIVGSEGALGGGKVILEGTTLQFIGAPVQGLVGQFWNGAVANNTFPEPGNSSDPYGDTQALFAARGNPVVTKVTTNGISFPNTTGAPFASEGFTTTDNMAVRWQGKILFDKVGTYGLTTQSDDGSMVYINGQLLVKNNYGHGYEFPNTGNGNFAGSFYVSEDMLGEHDIMVAFCEGTGGAGVTFFWTPPGGTQGVVPNSSMLHYAAGPSSLKYRTNVDVVSAATFDLTTAGGSLYELGTLSLTPNSTLTLHGAGKTVAFSGTNLPGGQTVTIAGTANLALGRVSDGTGTVNGLLDITTSGSVVFDYNSTVNPSDLNRTLVRVAPGARVTAVAGAADPLGGALGIELGDNAIFRVTSTNDNAVAITSPLTFSGNAVIEHTSPFTNTLAGAISLSGTLRINTLDGTLILGSPTLPGGINGASTIVKEGRGTARIGKAISSGSIVVNGGTLGLNASNLIGDALPVTVNNGGTFAINGFSEKVGVMRVNAGGAVTIGTGGSLSSDRLDLFGGMVAVNGGTLNLPAGTVHYGPGASSTAKIVGNGTVNAGGGPAIFQVNEGAAKLDFEFGASLGGNQQLQKRGGGALYLSGPSTFTGTVDVQAGDLVVNNNAALGDAANTIVLHAGTRLLGQAGAGHSMGTRSVSPAVAGQPVTLGTLRHPTVSSFNSTFVSGAAVTGGGPLNIVGEPTGIIELNQPQAVSQVNIDSGTLRVTNADVVGSVPVNVNRGGAFQVAYQGANLSNVTVNPGGTLAINANLGAGPASVAPTAPIVDSTIHFLTRVDEGWTTQLGNRGRVILGARHQGNIVVNGNYAALNLSGGQEFRGTLSTNSGSTLHKTGGDFWMFTQQNYAGTLVLEGSRNELRDSGSFLSAPNGKVALINSQLHLNNFNVLPANEGGIRRNDSDPNTPGGRINVPIEAWGHSTIRLQGSNDANSVTDETLPKVTTNGWVTFQVERGNQNNDNDRKVDLTITDLVRNPGSVINFTSSQSFTGSTLGTSSTGRAGRIFLGATSTSKLTANTVTPWALANGNDFAAYGPNGVVGLSQTAVTGVTYITGLNNAAVVNSSVVDQNDNITVNGSKTIQALRLTGGAARTITLNSNDLTITSGAIINDASSGASAIGAGTGETGRLIAGSAFDPQMLFFRTNQNQEMHIRVPVISKGITKSGDSYLNFHNQNNNFGGGNLHINQTYVRFYGAGSLGQQMGSTGNSLGAIYFQSNQTDQALDVRNNADLFLNNPVNVIGHGRIYTNNNGSGTGYRFTFGDLTMNAGRTMTLAQDNQTVVSFASTRFGAGVDAAGNSGLQTGFGNIFRVNNVIRSGAYSLGTTTLNGDVRFEINGSWDGLSTVNVGELRGAGNITVANGGTLSLTSPAASGFTGDFIVENGTLRLDSSDATGTGTIRVGSRGYVDVMYWQSNPPSIVIEPFGAYGNLNNIPLSNLVLPAKDLIVVDNGTPAPTGRPVANDWLGLAKRLDWEETVVDPVNTMYKGIAVGAFTPNHEGPTQFDNRSSLRSTEGDLAIYMVQHRRFQPLNATHQMTFSSPTGVVNVYGPAKFELMAQGGNPIRGYHTINRIGEPTDQNGDILAYQFTNAMPAGVTANVYSGRFNIHGSDDTIANGATVNIHDAATLWVDRNLISGTFNINAGGLMAVRANTSTPARFTSGATFNFAPGSAVMFRNEFATNDAMWQILANADIILEHESEGDTFGGVGVKLGQGRRITTNRDNNTRLQGGAGLSALPGVTQVILSAGSGRTLDIDDNINLAGVNLQIGDTNAYQTVQSTDNTTRHLVAQTGLVRLDSTSATIGNITVKSGTVAMGDNDADVLTAGNVVVEGNFGITLQGTKTFNSISGGNWTLNANAVAKINAPSTVNQISVNASAKIDVSTTTLTVNNTAIATVNALVATGRAGGNWNGNGIQSALLAADADKAYKTLAALPSGTGSLVKLTWVGDLNGDGAVTAADFFQMDKAYLEAVASGNMGGRLYHQGDLDYNGTLNGDDYFLIDGAFLNQNAVLSPGGPSAATSAVPEPSTLGMLAIGALGLLARRRRQA